MLAWNYRARWQDKEQQVSSGTQFKIQQAESQAFLQPIRVLADELGEVGSVVEVTPRLAPTCLRPRSGISRKNLSSEVSVVFPEPFAPATRVSLGWVTASAKRTAQGLASAAARREFPAAVFDQQPPQRGPPGPSSARVRSSSPPYSYDTLITASVVGVFEREAIPLLAKAARSRAPGGNSVMNENAGWGAAPDECVRGYVICGHRYLSDTNFSTSSE